MGSGESNFFIKKVSIRFSDCPHYPVPKQPHTDYSSKCRRADGLNTRAGAGCAPSGLNHWAESCEYMPRSMYTRKLHVHYREREGGMYKPREETAGEVLQKSFGKYVKRFLWNRTLHLSHWLLPHAHLESWRWFPILSIRHCYGYKVL